MTAVTASPPTRGRAGRATPAPQVNTRRAVPAPECPATCTPNDTTVVKAAALIEPTHEQIKRRAYEIYLSRNGRPGNAQLDWFEAEQQLRFAARRAAESDCT